jgi:hypothetical protein
LNATVLHQLGIDHERLNARYRGLDLRLTGVEQAHVIKPILTWASLRALAPLKIDPAFLNPTVFCPKVVTFEALSPYRRDLSA